MVPGGVGADACTVLALRYFSGSATNFVWQLAEQMYTN